MRRILAIAIKGARALDCWQCDQRRVKRFGTVFVCALFEGVELHDENGVPSGPGMLRRLPQCLAAGRQVEQLCPLCCAAHPCQSCGGRDVCACPPGEHCPATVAP